MARREKVFLDTSIVSGEENHGSFFGGRSELEQFASVADIFIPEMVIDEIREQKHRSLVKKQSSFLSNTFHKLLGVDETQTKNFNIREHIANLEEDETVEYELVRLSDYSVLPKMKAMVLAGQAPFTMNSDKGFKDTYIYFTVLEYVKTLEGDEIVFLVTGDNQLKEAFSNHPRVRVVADFAEFSKYRIASFAEDYFVKKLQAEVGSEILPESIVRVWLNVNENWVLQVETDWANYRIEVDFSSREIVGFCDKDIPERVNIFKTETGSFAGTHSAVSILSPYTSYLSDEEISAILREALSNRQIYLIASDEDVKAFLQSLFEARKNRLSDEEQADFVKKYYE